MGPKTLVHLLLSDQAQLAGNPKDHILKCAVQTMTGSQSAVCTKLRLRAIWGVVNIS